MDKLLLKLAGKIKAIARGLGNAGILDADDNEQNIMIGIINAFTKQPTATESYLLEAGRNYARDILKSERKKQARYVDTVIPNPDDELADVFDTIPHPNRRGRDAEVREFISELKNVLTYRQIVILDFVIDGNTLPEIAKKFDWQIRTIQREFATIRDEAQDIGHHFIDGYETPQGTEFKHEPNIYGRAIQLLLF